MDYFEPKLIKEYRKNFNFLDGNIYVYLTRRDGNFLSHLVSTFTRSIYTHAGIIINNNFDTCLESCPPVGVRYHSIESYNKNNIIDIYRVLNHKKISPKTIELKQQLFIKKVINKPYDWPSILGIVLNKKSLNKRDAYFCSELVFKFVKEVLDINLLKNLETYEVIPKYLAFSPFLTYIGSIDTSEYIKK